MKEKRVCINCILIAVVIGVLALATWLPSQSLAAPSAPLPPRPTFTPTPLPTLTPTPTSSRPHRPLAGAHIVLYVQAAPAGLWTIVQWQDALGGWHDVQGWQGTLDDGYQKLWWVAEKDFSTGPFRWALYKSQGGALLAVSASFHLPGLTGETVMVEASLGP
jgi:hypothetical protein